MAEGAVDDALLPGEDEPEQMLGPDEVKEAVDGLEGTFLVRAACVLLWEQNEEIVGKCLSELGREEFVRLLVHTSQVEQDGGVLTQLNPRPGNGAPQVAPIEPVRRRTPGGAFLYHVRNSCDKETRRRIFFLVKPQPKRPRSGVSAAQQEAYARQAKKVKATSKAAPTDKATKAVADALQMTPDAKK